MNSYIVEIGDKPLLPMLVEAETIADVLPKIKTWAPWSEVNVVTIRLAIDTSKAT